MQLSVFDKGPPSIEQHLCRPVSLTLDQVDLDECAQLNWLGAVFVRYDVEDIRFCYHIIMPGVPMSEHRSAPT